MKLKTLKDLDITGNSAWIVKQEAIKWVKEYGWKNPRIDIMVVFFNITEEDLK